MNQQKKFFTVIQDESFIKEISDKTLKMMEQNGITPSRPNMPFDSAPTVIVCSAPKVAKFGHDDIACSIMNMMHSAHSYGLGSGPHRNRFGNSLIPIFKKDFSYRMDTSQWPV